jgi:uncharacterized protein (DUF433 family)
VVASTEMDVLSHGIYTQRQAAYLARLHPQTAARWFDPSAARGPAIKRMLPQSDGAVVSFVDLIQLMAVRSIRLDRGATLQSIRQTASKAEEMGIHFPLARQDVRIYLLGDILVLGFADGSFIEASGTHAKHYLMKPVILPYLDDITFNDEGIARNYRPKAAVGVVLDPARQWGAPIVERCNYTVETLVNSVRAEGSIEAAAQMCEVSPKDIMVALRFEDFLRGSA